MAKQTKIQEMKNLLSKPELWIGFVTVFVIAVVAGTILVSSIRNSWTTKKEQAEPQTQTISRPVTPTIMPTQVPSEVVTRLADTAGQYEVQEGDNFWKISEKVCETGIYFESIQIQNGYESKTLHAGDLITVDCSQ